MDKLKATGPADILATIPHTLGFAPTNSLVLIALHRDRALGATLRIDLPQLHPTGAADYMAGLIRQDTEAIAVLTAIYDEDAPHGHWPDHGDYTRLVDALEDAGLPVMDGWHITADSYSSLTCQDACCPPEPLEQVKDSAVNAGLVFNGSTYAAEQGVPVHPGPAPELEERIKERIMAVEVDALTEDIFDFMQPAMITARLEWECALGTEPGEETAAVLLAQIVRKPVRDRIMADMIGAPADEEGMKQAILGRAKSVDWERALKFQALTLHLCAYAPAEIRADLLTMAGYLEWYKGRASNAGDLFAQAQQAKPGHRLSTLLEMMLSRGEVPLVATSGKTAFK